MQKKDVVRCGNCQKLLAKGVYSILEIKCARCGTLNHLRAESPEPERLRASEQGTAHALVQETTLSAQDTGA